MTKRFFEDFSVGDSAVSTVTREVSEHDVRECAALQGSYKELHMSSSGATKWDKPLAQGSLLGIIMIGLANRLPWDTEAAGLYGYDNFRFINPVFHGETVELSVEVVDTEEYDEDHGMLTFKEDLQKANGELAVTRERIFLVDKAPPDAA